MPQTEAGKLASDALVNAQRYKGTSVKAGFVFVQTALVNWSGATQANLKWTLQSFTKTCQVSGQLAPAVWSSVTVKTANH